MTTEFCVESNDRKPLKKVTAGSWYRDSDGQLHILIRLPKTNPSLPGWIDCPVPDWIDYPVGEMDGILLSDEAMKAEVDVVSKVSIKT